MLLYIFIFGFSHLGPTTSPERHLAQNINLGEIRVVAICAEQSAYVGGCFRSADAALSVMLPSFHVLGEPHSGTLIFAFRWKIKIKTRI